MVRLDHFRCNHLFLSRRLFVDNANEEAGWAIYSSDNFLTVRWLSLVQSNRTNIYIYSTLQCFVLVYIPILYVAEERRTVDPRRSYFSFSFFSLFISRFLIFSYSFRIHFFVLKLYPSIFIFARDDPKRDRIPFTCQSDGVFISYPL